MSHLNEHSFPDGFFFGAGTSAYQTEGAVNEEGKGETIWDTFIDQNPDAIADESNAREASASYSCSHSDINLARQMNLNLCRISLSWSRIMPTGKIVEDDPSHVLQDFGLTYYSGLIDEILGKEMTPLVVLHQWDLPERLMDEGGWENPRIVDNFIEYARLIFQHFGARVKYWITFARPWNMCVNGYCTGSLAPGLRLGSDGGEWRSAYYIMKAHALTYHMYQEEFKTTQNGQISISLDTPWFESTPDNEELAERMRHMVIGWFANPIYNGNYPEEMLEDFQINGMDNIPDWTLPKFEEGDDPFQVKGTSDFFSAEYFSSQLINHCDIEFAVNDRGINWFTRQTLRQLHDNDWSTPPSPNAKVAPQGLRKILHWIKRKYGDMEIFITANGFCDRGETEDADRTVYLQLHLSAALDAIQDGIRVRCFCFWSLIDGFEWLDGYTLVYGLYKVKFDDPDRSRIEKTSTNVMRYIIQENRLPECMYDDQPTIYFDKDEVWSSRV